MERHRFLDWSLPLGRYFGIDVRLHWTLLLLTLWELGVALHSNAPLWWLAMLIPIPFLSVLFHEFGHSFMARLVGGESSLIVMWMFGGLAMCGYPPSPGRQFAVSGAGPLVNFIILASCVLILGHGPSLTGALTFRDTIPAHNLAEMVLANIAQFNLAILAFNLLPCYPMDGGKMFQAALWPVAGHRRATVITSWASYVCIAGMFVYSVVIGSLFLMLFAMSFLFSAIQLHLSTRGDQDPMLGGYGNAYGDRAAARRQGWFARWSERRRERRREREEREEADEQVVLDRLLAKVSAEGLPSLTAAERAELHRISEKQKRRLEHSV
jgi:Zn-dependent protease